jgi:circadian clock protein KaiC
MASIGLDLESCIEKGLLRIEAARPTLLGIEAHLTRIQRSVKEFQPRLVVIDPISNLVRAGNLASAEAMLTRLVDFFKSAQITTVMTSLTDPGGAQEKTDVGVSSVIDTWILLRDVESNGERSRGIYILKSRGMAHANQIREFLLTPEGIRLRAEKSERPGGKRLKFHRKGRPA